VTQPIDLGVRASVAFSMLAIEQMPGALSKQAIDQMIRTGARSLVCFEPLRELYPRSLRGLVARLRHYRASYLTGLTKYVRTLNLNIVVERRTGLAYNPFNEICELVLETKN
jgi:hypothetical protein